MPDPAHPLPPVPEWEQEVILRQYRESQDDLPRGKGWAGISFVDIDGQNWPLEFASRMLDIPLQDLRDLVRIVHLEPAGVIRVAAYRRQGRQPRAYPAEKLIKITEVIRKLSEEITSVDARR